MKIRRKLKRERELVADINKCYRNFCEKQDCKDCIFWNRLKEDKIGPNKLINGDYQVSIDCKLEYVKYLLNEFQEATMDKKTMDRVREIVGVKSPSRMFNGIDEHKNKK